ncbi:hypothetical protein [Kitasatospora sp. NPDC093806]|uniref:hypothetical protein n=1 Tax=Kitasatospora sp. NPDC093806 TaxID=3155075 RepID=UPI00343523F3
MTNGSSRGAAGWYRAPLVSTTVIVLCLPVLMFLRGMAEMGLDPCSSEPGSCPLTHGALAFADGCLWALPVLLVVQWPVAYLARPARVPAALLPGVAALLEVMTVFGIQPGR